MIDNQIFREIEAFLFYEAEMLDTQQFDTWLSLWTDDASYRMPVRVTHDKRQAEEEFVTHFGHFDETREMLEIRVRRLSTKTAWAENPPSRTRHFVSNIRVVAEGNSVFSVRNNLLLYRNRGDSAEHDLLSAERHDVLRKVEDKWQISERCIYLDQSTLGTMNLSIFL